MCKKKNTRLETLDAKKKLLMIWIMQLTSKFRKALKSGALAASLALLATSASTTSLAQSSGVSRPLPSISGQSQIQKGLQAIEQNRWSYGESVLTGALGTLPSDAFYWLKYTKSYGDIEFSRISRFIMSHSDWPSMHLMKKEAERIMPVSFSNREITDWFDRFSPETHDGTMRYIDALIAQNRSEDAKRVIKDWWHDKLVSVDTQREFYGKYKNYLSQEDNRIRLDRLLFADYTTTGRNLASTMGGDYAALAEARIALSTRTGNVNALIAKVPNSLQNDAGLLYERLKWRRQHNLRSGAEEILAQQPDISKIANPNEWWRERHIIIREYLDEKNYSRAYQLAAANGQKEGIGLADGEFLAGWIAMNFLKKPDVAFNHFVRLYEGVVTPVSKSRGAYWAGVAAQRVNRSDVSNQWYRAAAYRQPSFYGMLAQKELDRTGTGYAGTPDPVITENIWNKWTGDERIRMAIMFYNSGFPLEARSFFLRAASDDNLSEADYAAIINIAERIGDRKSAVKVYKNAAYGGQVISSHGYPVENFNQISGLPPSAVLSIIRQESEFDPEIVSHAGARGYMQLMPETARRTARSLGISHDNSWLTSRKPHNVHLGSSYLRSMLERYDYVLPMAAAAYNAGPGNVDKWIVRYGDPRNGEIDILDWMELIPFGETRNYAQRVVEGYEEYERLFAGSSNSGSNGNRVSVKTLLP